MSIEQLLDEMSSVAPSNKSSYKRAVIDGVTYLVFPDGYRMPVIGGAEGDDPPAGDPDKKDGQGDPPPDNGGDNTDDEEPWDKDRGMKTINRLRQSEKDLKAKVKDFDAIKKRLDDLEDKDKTAVEKATSDLQKANDALTATQDALKAERLERAVDRAASKLGFIDPDDAVRLLDKDQIEYDDGGKPTNVEKLLKALAAAKPHLVNKKEDDSKGTGDKKAPPAGPNPNKDAKGGLNEEEQARFKNQQAQVYRSAW